MKPEIILHVGTEKTGSTSIQSLLRTSYGSLLATGVLFPQSIGEPCHIDFTACALGKDPGHPIRCLLGIQNEVTFNDFVIQTKKKLRDEIEKTNPRRIIISDEHINLHLSSVENLLAFKDLCEEFGKIKAVIIYLRRQDDFRLSLFSEAIKAGNLTAFDPVNPLPIFEKIPYRFNYLAILDTLCDVFGRDLMISRIYDRGLFPQGDIYADFLNAIDVELEYEGAALRQGLNRSLDQRIVKHLALISSSLSGQQNDWSEALRRLIVNNCAQIFSGSGVVLRKECHDRFLSQFVDLDKAVLAKYFDKPLGESLFPERSVGNRPTYPDCTMSWLEFFIRYVAASAVGSSSRRVLDEHNDNAPYEPTYELFGAVKRQDVDFVEATCPICGASYFLDLKSHCREGKLCPACGASGRAQAIAYHVTNILCDIVLPLKEHPINKTRKIIGLSDGKVYADILKDKYDYINTFYHRSPFLDISNPAEKYRARFDLLISTEVLEHVIGESVIALKGSLDLLKPGGYMILTVPFVNKGEFLEHYRGDLVNYSSYKNKKGQWVAEIEYKNGERVVDENAKFHGGPGKTLEIRLFNRTRLLEELDLAGFEKVCVHDENIPQYGINWGPASRIITARKPLN